MIPAPYIYSVKLEDSTLQLRMTAKYDAVRYCWNTSRHCHATYELHCILDGSAILEVEDTAYPLNTLDCILIAPGKYHYPTKVSDKFERFSISFFLSDSALLQQLQTDVPVCTVFSLPKRVLSACEAIYQEYTSENQYRHEMLAAHFTTLFIHILRQLDLCRNQKSSVIATEDARIEIIDEFFSDRFAEKGGETELAARLHLSKRQLARVLNKQYGMGFQRKMICARMEHAAWLLRNTDMRVSDISMQVGYASETTFYRSFAAIFHMTPLQYRKRKDT